MPAPVFTPKFLQNLNYRTLLKIGGPTKLLEALGTHPDCGLSLPRKPKIELDPDVESEGTGGDAFHLFIKERRQMYGANDPYPQPTVGMRLLWQALREDRDMAWLIIDPLILLFLELINNLVANPAKSFGQAALLDSLVIFGVILIQLPAVYYIASQEQHRCTKIANMDRTHPVHCIRNGEEVDLLAQDIVVGDIFILTSGSVAPCSGLVLSSQGFQCKPCTPNLYSKGNKKLSFKRYSALDANRSEQSKYSCFVGGRERVFDGWAKCVATSVGVWSDSGPPLGVRSSRGRRLESESFDRWRRRPERPLIKILALIVFQFIEFLFFIKSEDLTFRVYLLLVLEFCVVASSSLNSAPLIGLKLVEANVYSHLSASAIFERVRGACATMDGVASLVFDKTGTMTGELTVLMEGTVGASTTFSRAGSTSGGAQEDATQSIDWITLRDYAQIRDILNTAVVATTTAPTQNREPLLRNGVDWCLLNFTQEMGWMDPDGVWEGMECVEIIPFSSARRAGGALVRMSDGRLRLFVKGAVDEVLPKCTKHLVLSASPMFDVTGAAILGVEELDNQLRGGLNKRGDHYASNGLKSIVLGYKDFDQWSLLDEGEDDSFTQALYDEIADGVTLIGLFCLEDSLSPGVRDAFSHFIQSRMRIFMCTGDSNASAVSVAHTCGILEDQVLPEMTPDKKAMWLREQRRPAMVGNGSNDILALETAYLSFCMGLTGTAATKNTADLVLEDNDVAKIFEVVRQGRRVVDACTRYNDFWSGAGIATLLVISAISAVMPLPLPPTPMMLGTFSINQLVWVYVIVVPVGLAVFMTSSPDVFDVERERVPFTTQQEVYQHFLYAQMGLQPLFTLILYLWGPQIRWALFGGSGQGDDGSFGTKADGGEAQAQARTLAFNTFAFMQIFTCFLIWKIDKRVSINHAWMKKHRVPVSVFLAVIVFQYFIVMRLGNIFQTFPLDVQGWVLCLGDALVCAGFGRLAAGPFGKIIMAIEAWVQAARLRQMSAENAPLLETQHQ